MLKFDLLRGLLTSLSEHFRDKRTPQYSQQNP